MEYGSGKLWKFDKVLKQRWGYPLGLSWRCRRLLSSDDRSSASPPEGLLSTLYDLRVFDVDFVTKTGPLTHGMAEQTPQEQHLAVPKVEAPVGPLLLG